MAGAVIGVVRLQNRKPAACRPADRSGLTGSQTITASTPASPVGRKAGAHRRLPPKATTRLL